MPRLPRSPYAVQSDVGGAWPWPVLVAICALASLLALITPRPARAQDPADPYSPQQQMMMGQPFAQNPRMNPNATLMPGPPADVGTPTRPAGWPGAAPAQQAVVPARTARADAAVPSGSPAGGVPVNGATSGIAPAARQITRRRPEMATSRAGPPLRTVAGGLTGKARWSSTISIWMARVIARVGTEVIQEIEVKAYIDDIIEANGSRIPPQQLEKVRQKLTRDRLNHLIELKLALVDAKRKVPEDAYPKIIEGMGEEFERHEVRRKLQQLKLQTRGDLEAKMREHGSSLEREKQAFIEQQLAFGWISQQTKTKHETTHEDMLAYYLEHIEDYSFPAKARWEELRVRTPNFPNRMAARRA